MTGWDRTKWAETRDKYFSHGLNKKSLDLIESAAFMLILHDGDYILDLVEMKDPESLHNYGRQAMYGRIYDFWFDKTFNISFGTNGRVG